MARICLPGSCLLFLLCSTVGFAFQTPNLKPARSRIQRAPETAADAESHLRIDSSLVLIPVHVTTPAGNSVTSLAKENFRLFEDGVEQKITHFAQEDGPISIGLVFDSSGSMNNKMRQTADAAAAFFKTANPQDEFFLVEFNEHAKLTIGFTPDSESIYRRITHTKPFGRTSLLDAIHVALGEMKHARNLRKALVILSDGGDNRSRYTVPAIRNAMLESDLQMYAMGIFEQDPTRLHTAEEERGPRLLGDLTEQTGGQLYTLNQPDELAAISERISSQLRSQYVIGYSSNNLQRDGKYRHVKLVLKNPDDLPELKADFRRGYYAPFE